MKNFVVEFPCNGNLKETSSLQRLGVTCSCDILTYILYTFVFNVL